MSKAITYARFGGPEVLALGEVPAPEPAPGQVRVRVRAVGVNPIDVKIRRGDFGAGSGGFPRIPGLDVAGVVDRVGEGAAGVAAGDEVFGVAVGGAYAEYALMERPFAKPAGLSWEAAASLPTVAEAALRTLGHLALAAGETLLIHGAAGSVGRVATQLAVTRGVRVVGSVAARDDEPLRALGAVPVRYGEGLVERVRAIAPQGVDAVLDAAGRGALPDSIALAGGAGRVITIADPRAAELGVR